MTRIFINGGTHRPAERTEHVRSQEEDGVHRVGKEAGGETDSVYNFV